MPKHVIDKGGRAEEAIRCAFLGRGYCVVRGLPYRFAGIDITDVDLLLYGVTGSSRELLNVDVKNKKTPQAMERICWAMGIRSALRFDRCIVATSETHPAIVDFGRRLGVIVLDGHYLQHIMDTGLEGRISEEELIKALWVADAIEFSKCLRDRYMSAKARLLVLRNFDACNAFLRDVGDCLNDLLAYPSARHAVRRALYCIASFLCIALDAQWARSEFSESQTRIAEMDRGLRYGGAGRQRIDDFVNTLRQCKSDDANVGRVIESIEKQIESGVKEMRTDVLAEFISKWGEELFAVARRLDAAAFASSPPSIDELATSAKSFLFMLTDYCGLDRATIAAC